MACSSSTLSSASERSSGSCLRVKCDVTHFVNKRQCSIDPGIQLADSVVLVGAMGNCLGDPGGVDQLVLSEEGGLPGEIDQHS